MLPEEEIKNNPLADTIQNKQSVHSSEFRKAGVMPSVWKIVCVILLFYSVIAGLLIPVPRLAILNETIRNLFYHVPMWFSMIAMLISSLVYSMRYLGKPDMENDIRAEEYAKVGVAFGILGLLTGSIWAKYTWGAWWTNDVKLNGAAATMLVYFAYFLLRNSMDDEEKRARISAVYSIFAFALMTVFIFILPRLTDSLHPGNGGNPAFSKYDLDTTMRFVFYPAVAGWILLAAWIVNTRIRIRHLQQHLDSSEL